MSAVHHLFDELRSIRALIKEATDLLASGGSYSVHAEVPRLGSTLTITYNTEETLAALRRREVEIISDLNAHRADVEQMLTEIDREVGA
jgi:hypothetical protein